MSCELSLHYATIMSLLVGLASASIVLAGPESPPQSAWTRFPIHTDPDLWDTTLQRGQEVFQAHCQACHGDIPKDVEAGGMPPMPGTQALQIKYEGEIPALLEQRTDLTPELIATFVRNGVGSMPFFRPTEIPDEDLAALGAYLARKRP